MKIPKHVGIILDGNRRWAKERDLSSLEGHRQGMEQVEPILNAAQKEGVKYLSLFVFSSENWRRTVKEVNYLMDLILAYFKNERDRLLSANYCLKFLGRQDKLSPEVLEAIKETQDLSANKTGLTVVICLDYGGQFEIVDACQALIKAGIKKVTPKALAKHLYQPEVPDLDLVIRTSGEQRLSGFLLWRAAYAELIFLDKYWPDFGPRDLKDCLVRYDRRQRRFGG